MPLADLLAAIEAETESELAAVEAESRRRAAAIVDEATRSATRSIEQAVRAAEDAAREEARRRIGLARLEAARVVRQARETSFQEGLAATRGRLQVAREREGYARLFDALLRESLAVLPEATAVRVDPRDRRLAGDALRALGRDLDVEASLDTWGGLVLVGGDGRALRNTLEARLAVVEPELRRLFGSSVLGGEGAR